MTSTNGISRRGFLGTVPALVGARYADLPSTPYLDGDTTLPGDGRHGAPRREQLASDASRIFEILNRAIDSALSGGAVYADARVTRTISHSIGGVNFRVTDRESWAVSVRAHKNSSWGFSSSSIISAEQAADCGRFAVQQAISNEVVRTGTFDIRDYAPVTGTWKTPIAVDPFSVSIEEKTDFMRSWYELADQYEYGVSPLPPEMGFYRQERYFVSSTGSRINQEVSATRGGFGIAVGNGRQIPVRIHASGLTNAGKGWELFRDARLADQIPALTEEGKRRLALTWKPVDIGRFTVIMDGMSVANTVDSTFGGATQLDRALGLEVNSGGSSFLGPDPFAFLGEKQITDERITLKANRSSVSSLATIGWDDDGVKPVDFDIISKGKLVNYQTSRDTVGTLRKWYEAGGKPTVSNGCASSQSANNIPILASPNLELVGSDTTHTGSRIAEMIANTDDGLLLRGASTAFDYQCRSGTISGLFQSIKNGVVGDAIIGAAILFDADDWLSVVEAGSPAESATVAAVEQKGEPEQSLTHSVTAIPLKFANLAVIDVKRTV